MSLRIGIVGAGPIGLASALQLRRAGLDAELTLFDAQADPQLALRDPRVLALSEGSRLLLHGIDGWPQAAATPITRIHVSQLAPGLAALPRAELDAAGSALPALGYTVRYGDLLAQLRQAADAAALHVHHGVAAQVAPGSAGAPWLHADDGADLGAFDLVLLAEGGAFHTQGRRRLWRDYHQTALVGVASPERPHQGLAIERFTRDGPVALLPCGADHALVWCVPPGAVDATLALSPTQQRDALQALLPAAAGRLRAVAIHGHFPLGLNADWSARDGRLVQLGNAAQTLHPVAGQGLNLGLRDSAALVRALRRETDPTAALDSVLRRWDLGRLPDRLALFGFTDLLARGFTWDWPGAAALRATGLGLLAAAPPLRDALQRRMIFGWR